MSYNIVKERKCIRASRKHRSFRNDLGQVFFMWIVARLFSCIFGLPVLLKQSFFYLQHLMIILKKCQIGIDTVSLRFMRLGTHLCYTKEDVFFGMLSKHHFRLTQLITYIITSDERLRGELEKQKIFLPLRYLNILFLPYLGFQSS